VQQQRLNLIMMSKLCLLAAYLTVASSISGCATTKVEDEYVVRPRGDRGPQFPLTSSASYYGGRVEVTAFSELRSDGPEVVKVVIRVGGRNYSFPIEPGVRGIDLSNSTVDYAPEPTGPSVFFKAYITKIRARGVFNWHLDIIIDDYTGNIARLSGPYFDIPE
jgi:hypothetical protein